MSDNPNVKKRHKRAEGSLIIIGGNESSDGEILKEVAANAKRHGSRIVIIAASSSQPEETESAYEEIFSELGVKDVRILHLDIREDALKEENLAVLDGVKTVFFSGGDQL